MDGDRAHRLLTQIEAFETKVKVSEDSFSGHKLKEFLPELKRKTDVNYVDSIATLKKLVKKKSDKLDRISSASNYNDDKTLVYFKWFVDFHGYLKSLKESFDDRVYKHLLQYFYDSPYGTSSTDKSDKSFHSSASSGYASSLDKETSLISLKSSSSDHDNIHPTLKDVYKEYKELSDAVEEDKINKLAERLFVTGRQLERLLQEDVPVRQLILSSYQTRRSGNTDDGKDLAILFEKIFKVLKDSAKQAKRWVHLDTMRSVNLQLARQRFKDMHKTISMRIQELDEIVNEIKNEMDQESEGLHKLLKREERASDISSQIFEMEDNISQREDELKRMKLQQESIRTKLRKSSQNEVQDIEKELKDNQIQFDSLARDIEAKKYCKRLLQGDLDVEMRIKPSIIRFTNNVQEKCESLETKLSKQRRERAVLLDFIERLRGDRQRIESEILRQVMLVSSLDSDIAKHRPSINPPRKPSVISGKTPQPDGRFVNLSSAGSAQ